MAKSTKKKTSSKTVTKKESKPKKQEEKQVIEKHETKGGDPVWAIFLITIGLLFLLNNFGILPWGIWGYLWRFWPVFLILGGIRMIFGKNIVSTILVAILGVSVIGTILLYVTLPSVPQFDNWMEREMPSIHRRARTFINYTRENIEEKNISVDGDSYENVSERDVSLEIGARTVTIEETEKEVFMSIDANYVEDYSEPEVIEEFNDGILTLDLDTTGKTWGWGMMENPFMNIKFGYPEIPTSLTVNLGAGTINSELSELMIKDFSSIVGAGTLNLTLTEDNLSETDEMSLEVGAGTMNITMPDSEDIGFKVIYDVGVGTLNIGSNNLKGNGTYESDNYDDADTQIDISAKVGVGTINFDLE